jgi:chromate transporter
LKRVFEVFKVFLRLGLTSFGGPIAHLSYFHDEFVLKRKWIDEHNYAELVALCQFLPGPSSSQVGIALGLLRAGIFGAIGAWIGFTLPSALILLLFALVIKNYGSYLNIGWLHGLKIAAVAIVAQAIFRMGATLCPDKQRATIAVLSSVIAISIPSVFAQIGIILIAGVIGWIFLKDAITLPHTPNKININKKIAGISLIIFFLILFLMPLLSIYINNDSLKLFDSFYRVGSLVFGGGHVVLPLLQSEVVVNGWVSNDEFMAGYGAAQALPGPLFSFAAYLGAISKVGPSSLISSFLCLIGVFLPSFLLIIGIVPFWENFRKYIHLKNAILGINAAVVGLLLSAFYNPVWSNAVHSTKDFSLAIFTFLLLVFWKIPSWVVVILCAIISGLI